MQTQQARCGEAPRIRHDDPRKVVVHPEDNDLFMLPSSEATRACVNHAQFQEFNRMMATKWSELRRMVAEWCENHSQVSRAIISARDPEYLLLLIVQGDEHDFELSDAVSDLDLELREKFPVFPASVMTVTAASEADAVLAFVDETRNSELYARASKPQGSR